jgi:Co/Zn/Cd efflux system component
MNPVDASAGLRRAVALVAALNLGFFGIEFGVALAIGSVALLADSIDFLEDASINLLILLGLGWSLAARARLGMVLAGILLVPSLATIWVAARKLLSAEVVVPDPTLLALTGLAALAVNLTCAVLLARHRRAGGSLARAAFLSARNDAIANVAIIGAGLTTAVLLSPWPDLVVGIGIAVLNAGAAREVWQAARGEAREARG